MAAEQTEAYKRFDQIVTVTEKAVEGFKKELAPEFEPVVIPNLMDMKNIHQAALEPIEAVTDEGTVKLVTTGRLEESKGFDKQLHGFKRLRDEGVNVHLTIIEEGTERKNVEDYVEQHHLNKEGSLLGFQKNPYKFMNEADVFVCSSLSEGYSLVVTEALVLGKAIVSTRCADPRELLNNREYGVLIDINAEDLYRGLKSMIQDSKTRKYFACKARERGKMFDPKRQLHEIEQVLISEPFEGSVDDLKFRS